MVFLLGLYGGSRRRIHAKSGGAAWRTSAAPVRQLFCRLRSRWRNTVQRPRRGAVRFGYDLQSYSQNFDDGRLVSGYRY